jgi:hypothetical protein
MIMNETSSSFDLSNSYGVNTAEKVNRDGTKDPANMDLFDRITNAAKHIGSHVTEVSLTGVGFNCGSCHDPYAGRSNFLDDTGSQFLV